MLLKITNIVRASLANSKRIWKKFFFVCVDSVLLVFLVWAAFSFRFGEVFSPNLYQIMLMAACPIITIPIFARMGLYRSVLRYMPERAIWTIVQSVSIATLVWVSLAFLTRMTGAEGVPRTIPVVFWTLAIITVVSTRFGAKWVLYGRARDGKRSSPTLIYGTGEAALQLANALKASSDRLLIGFVSDDTTVHGLDILGLRVYAPKVVPQIVANFGVEEIVLTSSKPFSERRDLILELGNLPVKIRILPAITDLASGRYLVSHIRDINLDDLLGRSEIMADDELLRSKVEHRVVLVTGAAGSIGSALCHTIASCNPLKLVLLEMNEYALYKIKRELKELVDFPIVSVLGSVTNPDVVNRILSIERVDTIYHCAAYKHVSLVEENILEGIRNNVIGTYVVTEAAYRRGIPNLVLISSDKAVRPTSVMGATKRWSELIVHYFGTLGDQNETNRSFCSVRFGNVIGSSGSVVPLFREQIARGGPVTITHKDMTRYFMSVREAAELIVQASALAESGDILLLDMGDPIRIKDLAEDMIVLAGLSVRDAANPGGDIEIVEIGPQPGEKLFEELFYDSTAVSSSRHPRIQKATPNSVSGFDIPQGIDRIEQLLADGNEEGLRRALFECTESGPQ